MSTESKNTIKISQEEYKTLETSTNFSTFLQERKLLSDDEAIELKSSPEILIKKANLMIEDESSPKNQILRKAYEEVLTYSDSEIFKIISENKNEQRYDFIKRTKTDGAKNTPEGLKNFEKLELMSFLISKTKSKELKDTVWNIPNNPDAEKKLTQNSRKILMGSFPPLINAVSFLYKKIKKPDSDQKYETQPPKELSDFLINKYNINITTDWIKIKENLEFYSEYSDESTILASINNMSEYRNLSDALIMSRAKGENSYSESILKNKNIKDNMEYLFLTSLESLIKLPKDVIDLCLDVIGTEKAKNMVKNIMEGMKKMESSPEKLMESSPEKLNELNTLQKYYNKQLGLIDTRIKYTTQLHLPDDLLLKIGGFVTTEFPQDIPSALDSKSKDQIDTSTGSTPETEEKATPPTTTAIIPQTPPAHTTSEVTRDEKEPIVSVSPTSTPTQTSLFPPDASSSENSLPQEKIDSTAHQELNPGVDRSSSQSSIRVEIEEDQSGLGVDESFIVFKENAPTATTAHTQVDINRQRTQNPSFWQNAPIAESKFGLTIGALTGETLVIGMASLITGINRFHDPAALFKIDLSGGFTSGHLAIIISVMTVLAALSCVLYAARINCCTKTPPIVDLTEKQVTGQPTHSPSS